LGCRLKTEERHGIHCKEIVMKTNNAESVVEILLLLFMK